MPTTLPRTAAAHSAGDQRRTSSLLPRTSPLPSEKKSKKGKEKNVGDGSTHGGSEGSSNGSKIVSKSKKKKKENISEVPSEKKGKKGKEKSSTHEESSKTGKTKRSNEDDPMREKKKKVSFSDQVEEFPPREDKAEDGGHKDLVLGKRWSPEEDQLIKDAIDNYIQANQLGNEGLDMVLNCSKHRQLRGCWNVIAESIPWRPQKCLYERAHSLFKGSKIRKWEPHEYETLLRLHKVYGGDYVLIGKELGRYNKHVKDMWRFISRKSHSNKGSWSQEEYQKLFDLVNLNFKMNDIDHSAFRRGMTRDNIPWEAVSDKLATRSFQGCCSKWYRELASSLVSEGLWLDTDDYRMMHQLQKLDAYCVEDVDWDNLLEHRSGEICRKRWEQMTRYIGGHKERSFIEQVDLLSSRYCTEVLEYRKDDGCSGATTPPNDSSIPE